MVGVTDLRGSGGAERQFSDLFEHFRRTAQGDVTLITARLAVRRLREAARLRHDDGVIALPLGSSAARGALNVAWMTLWLMGVTFWRRFDVVHLCLPTPSYVPFAAFMTRLPRAVRPRVVLSVIDCTLAPNLAGRTPADEYERQVVEAHRLYFRWTRLDGIYTWYRRFAELCAERKLVAEHARVRAARYCFTDPARFTPAPEKERRIVFAGRLSEQKRPWLFVEAVAALAREEPELVRGWRFEMYGNGPLEPRLRDAIRASDLERVLTLTSAPDLAPVFARSRLFVSTQALENFTSLAMLEAMAAGNAVVAEDVGQTREFVRDRENGLLVPSGAPEAFAHGIAEYLRHPEWHEPMARASRTIASEVHTIENFADDIADFWRDVAGVS